MPSRVDQPRGTQQISNAVDLTLSDEGSDAGDITFVRSVPAVNNAATPDKRATPTEKQQAATDSASRSPSQPQTCKGDPIDLRSPGSGTVNGKSTSSRQNRDHAIELSPRPKTVAQNITAKKPPRRTSGTPIDLQSADSSEDDFPSLQDIPTSRPKSLLPSRPPHDQRAVEQVQARPSSPLKRQRKSGASSPGHAHSSKRPRFDGPDGALPEPPPHAIPDSNLATGRTLKRKTSSALTAQPSAKGRLTPVLPARKPALPTRPSDRSELRQSSPTESPRSGHAHLTPNPLADLRASEERRSSRQQSSSQEVGRTTLGPSKLLSSRSKATTPAADSLSSRERRRLKKLHAADLQESVSTKGQTALQAAAAAKSTAISKSTSGRSDRPSEEAASRLATTFTLNQFSNALLPQDRQQRARSSDVDQGYVSLGSGSADSEDTRHSRATESATVSKRAELSSMPDRDTSRKQIRRQDTESGVEVSPRKGKARNSLAITEPVLENVANSIESLGEPLEIAGAHLTSNKGQPERKRAVSRSKSKHPNGTIEAAPPLTVTDDSQTQPRSFEADMEAAEANDQLQSEALRAQSASVFAVPQSAASALKATAAYTKMSLANKVERVLGQFMEELAQDNEYWTGNSLMRARLSKESGPALQPPAQEKLTSFRHLKPLNLAPAQKHDPAQLTWGIEQMANGRPVSSERVVLPRKTFTTHTQDVPNYAHYVSITNNILASNSKVLHCWPYFGDDFDNAEAGNLKEQYHMDIDGREQKLLRLGQAQKLETYVESALQELGCSWSDVLRFLLEENLEVGTNPDALKALRNRPDFCKEDFERDDERWTAVLATLPPSNPAQLARAGVLCENFQKMARFPLWHVARRSDLCKLPGRASPLHDKTVASDELTCRICMRFDCPYHGEITERPESEEREDGDDSDISSVSVVATDLVHPPHINYRTRVAFPEVDRIQAQFDNLTVKPGRKNPTYWQSYENKAEDRGPFYPCSHPGKSCDDEDADCSCFHENIPCEKSCGCSSACVRRFQGCSCSTQRIRVGKRGPCFEDERCACWQTGRECDPDLCGDCGVCEVVDPVNRHDENILLGRCQNACIQRGVAKCTLLGDSGIHGFGLYACEDIRLNEFVGEYKGEIITKQEAERRGAVYDHQRLSYLFSLNRDQEVDSTYFGNKMRFINHASNGKESLSPRIIMVNTVYRIALYAGRNIRKGEELLFNYGEQFPEEQLGGKRAKKSAPQVRNANLVKNFDAVEEDEDELGNVRAKAVSSAGRKSKSRKPRGGARAGAGRKPRQKDGANPATVQQTQRDESPFADDFAGQDAGARLAAYNVADDRASDQMDWEMAAGAEDQDDDEYEESEEAEIEASDEDGDSSEDAREEVDGILKRRPGRPSKRRMGRL